MEIWTCSSQALVWSYYHYTTLAFGQWLQLNSHEQLSLPVFFARPSSNDYILKGKNSHGKDFDFDLDVYFLMILIFPL